MQGPDQQPNDDDCCCNKVTEDTTKHYCTHSKGANYCPYKNCSSSAAHCTCGADASNQAGSSTNSPPLARSAKATNSHYVCPHTSIPRHFHPSRQHCNSKVNEHLLGPRESDDGVLDDPGGGAENLTTLKCSDSSTLETCHRCSLPPNVTTYSLDLKKNQNEGVILLPSIKPPVHKPANPPSVLCQENYACIHRPWTHRKIENNQKSVDWDGLLTTSP